MPPPQSPLSPLRSPTLAAAPAAATVQAPPPLLHFPPGYSPNSNSTHHHPNPTPHHVQQRPRTWQDRLEDRLSRICSWVPFVIVCAILAWSIYAFVFLVGPLMDGRLPVSTSTSAFAPPHSPPVPPPSGPHPWTTQRIAGTVLVGLLWTLTLWSYAQVVFTNPGSPKSVLAPPPISPALRSREADSAAVRYSHPSDATIVPIHSDDIDNHVPLDVLTIRGGTMPAGGPAVAEQRRHNNNNTNADTEESVPLVPLTASSDPVLVPTIHTKRNGAQRYCRKCDMPKPDRAHHCRICNQCVLKMDHHCPWVAGCVGFGNYKFFLLFLFYLSLYCFAIFGFTVGYFFLALATGPIDQFVTASNVLGLTVCSLLFGLTLFGFLCYHLSLVFANQTTIESMETQRYDPSRLAPQPPSKPPPAAGAHDNPFDLGWKRNFIQVFGPARMWWVWLVPVASHLGDGITYPVALLELGHAHDNDDQVHQLV